MLGLESYTPEFVTTLPADAHPGADDAVRRDNRPSRDDSSVRPSATSARHAARANNCVG